jgi:hypothetical protein
MPRLLTAAVLGVLLSAVAAMDAHAQARRSFPNSPDVIEIDDGKTLLEHVRTISASKAVLMVVFMERDLSYLQQVVARVNREQRYSVLWIPALLSRVEVQRLGDGSSLPKPYCACESAAMDAPFLVTAATTILVLDSRGTIAHRSSRGVAYWRFESDPAVSGQRVSYSLHDDDRVTATRLWAATAKLALDADRLWRDLELAKAELHDQTKKPRRSAPAEDPEVLTDLEGFLQNEKVKLPVFLSGETRADGLAVTALRAR